MASAAETLRQRIDSLEDSDAYRNYRYVRERVLALKDLESSRGQGVHRPSEYWTEELGNFEYMLDASPLVIEKLRHHCFHITGLKVYDYRTNKDKARDLLAEKLRALREVGGDDLLVPEPRALGGFGFDIDRALYNVDTLKFYEVLIALQRGEVLRELQAGGERRLVWEIGTGWGGFPYQFKKVCPDTTYVLMDFPELFLYSATYLMSMFPEAKVAIHHEGPLQPVLDRWQEVDFIFVSNAFLDEFRPLRLDLAINMISFQEMTTEQVRAYVRAAYDLGAPYLYSLNRDRSPYNTELSGVSELIGEHFWPREVDVLPVPYTQMLDKLRRAKRIKNKLKAGRSPNAYRHLIGWRRMES